MKMQDPEWLFEHLYDAEPEGHGLTVPYLAKVRFQGDISFSQEHAFQHNRDKRAGVEMHTHEAG